MAIVGFLNIRVFIGVPDTTNIFSQALMQALDNSMTYEESNEAMPFSPTARGHK